MSPIATFNLAFTALRRDIRAGELKLLALALLIAVAAMSSVEFFVERVRTTLNQETHQLLAADLVVAATHPIREATLQSAQDFGLSHVRMATFNSVASAGDKFQLADLKVVEDDYPLRGELQIAPTQFSSDLSSAKAPASRQVWVEPRILQTLALAVGDSLTLGNSIFRIAGVIVLEPDRGSQAFAISPRIIMNYRDLAATGLVLPGSRIRHALLLAGSDDAIANFRNALELETGERVESVDEARPEVNRALERAEQFLALAALTAVIVAGIAIALSAQRFASRHLDTCAIMRTFGASQRGIISVFALEMLMLGLSVSIIGALFGYGAHLIIVSLLADNPQSALAPAGWAPLGRALLTGAIGVLGFAMPPLVALWQVPPLRVLRRDLKPEVGGHSLLYLAAIAAIVALAPWRTGSSTVTAFTLGGTFLACLALALLSWLMVRLLRRVRHSLNITWRYGLASIARHARASIVQTTALGLGVMILLLLAVIRNDLLDSWRDSLPDDAPNHFMINIQPDDVTALRAFLVDHSVAEPGLFPMIRGRITAINGGAVDPDRFPDPLVRRRLEREFNLSVAAELAADNHLAEGQWWPTEQPPAGELSLESGIARDLGLTIGDTITWQIADSQVTSTITNLRDVDWDSFNVNFFAIGSPGTFDSQPATFITAFHAAADNRSWLPELLATFPSVTLIDVDAVMRQVRGIMDRVTLALEFVFGFTVLAGLLVLWAALQTTQDERRYDVAIFKSVGAPHSLLRTAALAELTVVGALAGLVAAVAAGLAGGVLAREVFQMDYLLNPLLFPIGMGISIVVVTAGGYLALRHALREPAITLLRQGI
ncbi:MAG: ABC transporter permease [Gammaproteobacteria bacterium]|nr:ABC transporter permease [Gammaproteobacteria bacterium]